ncbi:hypothetical protein V8F33_010635 [Rhypophila sp. PSN 637]
MKFTTLNLALLATTAMAASIPREEQPQIVLADVTTDQLGHQQPQPTSSPSSPEEERIHGAGMTMLTTTVTKTKTATIAMTTATVFRTETATPTAQPSSSSPHWSWTSLSNWLFGSSRAGHCAGGNSAAGLGGLEGIKPNLLAEGMGCFCSAGSVCCYNSNAQVMCNYGTCGVI